MNARRLLLLAALVFYTIFIVRCLFFVDGTLYSTLFDDAMISMRYARNLAHGAGLVWNPGGPRVQGFTNPAWTLTMSAVHVAGVPPRLAPVVMMLIGAALLLAAASATHRVARDITGSEDVATAAAAFTSFGYALVFWTLRGMEVGALAALFIVCAGAAIRYARERRLFQLVIVALTGVAAMWTRADALIPFLVIAVWTFWNAPDRRGTLAGVACGAVVLGAGVPLLLSDWYYGVALPNTYYLKLEGAGWSSRWARGGPALIVFLLRGQAAALVPAVALVASTHATSGRARRELGLLAGIALALGAYSLHVGGDAWEWMGYANRYISVAVPQMAVLMAAGAHAFVKDDRSIRIGVPAFAALLVIQAALLVFLASRNRVVDVRLLDAYRAHPLGWAAFAFGGAVLLTGIAAGASHRRSFVGVCVAIWLAANGVPFVRWSFENGAATDGDQRAARVGLLFHDAVAADARVAVAWAGSVPYFAERTAIDMLGKTDPVIARMPPVTDVFVPGHNKWDLRYSIGRLRPDLACDLPRRPADLSYLAAQGYHAIGGTCFVRPDARLNESELRAGLAGLDR